MRSRQAKRTDCRFGLGTTDGPLQIEQYARFGLLLALGTNHLLNLRETVTKAKFLGCVDVLQNHIIMHGHVTRSLVGDMHIMSVLDKTNKRTTHRDHIVIGVGREDQHTLREGGRGDRTRRVIGVGLATRPTRNRVLQVVEDPDIDLVERTCCLEQFAQRIFDIIVVGQLQNRLIHLTTQPHHRLTHKARCPFARTYQPGSHLARQKARGILVHYDLHIAMALQERGRHVARNLPLDDIADHRSLALAPRHQHHLIGAHDGVDAHRDGHLGRFVHIMEELRLHLARIVRELYQTRARFLVRTRLVETDLTLLTDTDDHQIDAANLVVHLAVVRNLIGCHRAIEDMDILGTNVDVIQKFVVDAVVAALRVALLNRIELIEAINHHVAERHLALLVALHQLTIQTHRGTTRRQAQHKGVEVLVEIILAMLGIVLTKHLHDHIGQVRNTRLLGLEDTRRHLLIAV